MLLVSGGPALPDLKIFVEFPAEHPQVSFQRRQRRDIFWRLANSHYDAQSARAILLCSGTERPHRHRAGDAYDKFAPLHSITSSVSANRFGGGSTPIAFAVFRLITNSNLVGCCTGSSAGLAPF